MPLSLVSLLQADVVLQAFVCNSLSKQSDSTVNATNI